MPRYHKHRSRGYHKYKSSGYHKHRNEERKHGYHSKRHYHRYHKYDYEEKDLEKKYGEKKTPTGEKVKHVVDTYKYLGRTFNYKNLLGNY